MNEDETQETSSPLDDPPVDALADLFELPPHLASDPRYVRWHTELVRRLRSEASGVPMKSGQYTLMERIATSYIDIRAKEIDNPNRTPRERREDNASYLALLQEFNRLLEKHNDKVVRELLVQVKTIVDEEVLNRVSDKTEKQAIRRALGERFASIDI